MQLSDQADFRESHAAIAVDLRQERTWLAGQMTIGAGRKALYFRYLGSGAVDFLAFELQ